jgi:hypothetical protein
MRPDRVSATAIAIAAATAAVAVGVAVGLAGCGAGASGGSTPRPAARITAQSAARLARWTPFLHTLRPLDLTGPRSDGTLVLAAAGRLRLLNPATGKTAEFATRYHSPGGEEPYIVLSSGGCLGTDTVYALHLRPPRGVVRISSSGAVRQFARLSASGLIDGIAVDTTGAFGHRLLVTIAGSKTTVDAIDCRGRVTEITNDAPRVEGGIAVAPRSFGRFAGDLIAPDEQGGGVYAITPGGHSRLVVASGLPHGPDTGVESAGFVPEGGGHDAFMADRVSPGNAHPGDDVVLRLGHVALAAVGVRAGDLLVGTEGGALVDAIRCGRTRCSVRQIADGPSIAHGEGHIAFAPAS